MAGCAFDHSANCLSVRLFVAGLCCSLAETQREKRCQRAEEIFFPATSFHSHQINPNKMLIHVFFLLLLFFSVTVSEFWLCNRPFRLRPWGKLAYLMKSDHSLLTWGFSIHIFGGEQIFRDWVKKCGSLRMYCSMIQKPFENVVFQGNSCFEVKLHQWEKKSKCQFRHPRNTDAFWHSSFNLFLKSFSLVH